MENTDITANILSAIMFSFDDSNPREIMKNIAELLTKDKERTAKRGRRNV